MSITNGYYWMQLKGEELEVVEVVNNIVYRCGNEITYHLKGENLVELGGDIGSVYISGPLLPPIKLDTL